jgi:hypothetical protein
VRIQRFPRPSGNIVGKRRRNIPASTDLQLGWFITEEIAVADVNGDGKPDVLLSNYCADSSCQSNGVISVLLGDGKGGFAPPQNYSSGGNLAEALALADFNGDGKLDVVVYSPCAPGVGRGTCEAGQVNGVMGVLLGNGDGTFQAALTAALNLSGSLTVADFNGSIASSSGSADGGCFCIR